MRTYKRDSLLSIILSLIVFIPLGVIIVLGAIFTAPLGLLLLPVAFIMFAVAFLPLAQKSKENCPCCGKVVIFTRKTTAFYCPSCKCKLLKINDRITTRL